MSFEIKSTTLSFIKTLLQFDELQLALVTIQTKYDKKTKTKNKGSKTNFMSLLTSIWF